MPWMLHVPETISELLDRIPQVVDAEAPIWDLSGSSGTLHSPPEKKRKSAGEAIQMSDRWRRKASRESAIFDMGNGCHCGCVYTLNIAAVLEMREEHMRQDQAERRAFMRAYISDNIEPSSNVGVALQTLEDVNHKLCVTGFDVYHGWAKSWTYKYLRDHKARITQDDPN